MDSTPLVSVIVACYNSQRFIDGCFGSLLEQTCQDFEIVACDDGSTDQTYSILQNWAKKDKRIIALHNETNQYAAAARNKCIENSRGKYLLIQDVDDYSTPSRIERLLQEFAKDEKIDFISTQMKAFRDTPDVVDEIMDTRIEYPTKYDFLWGLPFHHPAAMFTKSCIDSIHGYRVAEETRKGQDYDLFMRLYAKGYRGKNIFEPLYLFRRDAENIKRRDFKARIWEYKIRNYGFREMGMMPWAYIFTLKPFIAHFYQKIRFASISK